VSANVSPQKLFCEPKVYLEIKYLICNLTGKIISCANGISTWYIIKYSAHMSMVRAPLIHWMPYIACIEKCTTDISDTHTRRRGQKSRATKSKPGDPEPEPVKPVQGGSASSTDVVQDDVISQSSSRSNVTSADASSTEQDLEAGNGSRISEPSDDAATRESGRPSKRRAASAVASFKEPSLNKKLRQGDNLNKDAKLKESKTKKKSSGGEKK